MATHCSILAQKIPWTEDPGELQSMRSKMSQTRLRHNLDMTEQQQQNFIYSRTKTPLVALLSQGHGAGKQQRQDLNSNQGDLRMGTFPTTFQCFLRGDWWQGGMMGRTGKEKG